MTCQLPVYLERPAVVFRDPNRTDGAVLLRRVAVKCFPLCALNEPSGAPSRILRV